MWNEYTANSYALIYAFCLQFMTQIVEILYIFGNENVIVFNWLIYIYMLKFYYLLCGVFVCVGVRRTKFKKRQKKEELWKNVAEFTKNSLKDFST